MTTIRADAPASYEIDLPAPARESIAGHLDALDLDALSRVSRAWLDTGDRLWQQAYGPSPCHRLCDKPADWRRAVLEKAAYQERLFAPVGGVGSACVAGSHGEAVRRAARLFEGKPLAAYMAVQAAGAAGRFGPAAVRITLAYLFASERLHEARHFGRQALDACPEVADDVMNAALRGRDTPICMMAAEAGATITSTAPPEAFENALKQGDAGMLRFLLKHSSDAYLDRAIRYEAAVDRALQGKSLECLKIVLAMPRVPVFVSANFARLQDEATLREALALMQQRNFVPSFNAIFRTASDLSPFAIPATRLLLATFSVERYGDAQALLNLLQRNVWMHVSANSLEFGQQLPSDCLPHRILEVLSELGAQLDLEEFNVRSWVHHLNDWPTVLWGLRTLRAQRLRAGNDPETISGDDLPGIILCKVLDCMPNDERAQILQELHRAGLRIRRLPPARASDSASVITNLLRTSPEAGVAAALLDMGLDCHEVDPKTGESALFVVARTDKVDLLRVFIEAGASPHEYNAEFETLLDVATSPECRDYLLGFGCRTPKKP